MSSREYEDRKFQEVFEQTRADLQARWPRLDATAVAELRGTLETQYVASGNDWVGRGRLNDIVQQATIAAMESTLADWEKKLGLEGRPD